MAVYDVFNGDADGICALTQMRLAQPLDSELITGVKRDIKLLAKIQPGAGDQVNVLDISMDKNKQDLLRILEAGANVFYCDHHVSGDIPDSPQLDALINPAADTCTSVLINGRLKGAFIEWAIVGAFGDNLKATAQKMAATTQLSADQVAQLDNLGQYINYNGYGASLDDLHFTPEALYRIVSQYKSPLDFIAGDQENFSKLETGFHEDMRKAAQSESLHANDSTAAFLLPDEAWARRVSGVYGNDLANLFPGRAHAVLTSRADGTYLVSVRAPLENKVGADQLCMEFPTGGGRKAAAGINALPADRLGDFLQRFNEFYQ